jgi:hypothetical protein
MMRALVALVFVVWGLSVVCAWKDWYKALCGLIIFSSILRYPDMPRTILGVQGLNLWNVLLFIVLLGWIVQRRRDGLRWDMPRAVRTLLLLGLGVVVVGFLRLLMDTQSLVEDWTIAGLVSDYLINPVKWVVVGLLLFDGCRDRRRLLLGLASILSFYVLIGLQVIRAVLPGVPSAGSLSEYAMMAVATGVGHHRNDVSVMLAGASWALLAMWPMVLSVRYRAAILLGSLLAMLALALTGGRGGYLAWAAVGLTLGLVRWRRYLLLVPLAVILLMAVLPSAVDRALHGLVETAESGSSAVDLNDVTSGRTLIWPLVVDEIRGSPFIGYGRAAMQRTGLSALLEDLLGSVIHHPHNAYLEMLLDSGVIGLLVALALYGTFVATALSLVRDRRSPESAAVGGVVLALGLAQLVGSFSGQSFWPRETTLGIWCAVGLLLRVWVQRSRISGSSLSRRADVRSAESEESETWLGATVPAVPAAAWWSRDELQHGEGHSGSNQGAPGGFMWAREAHERTRAAGTTVGATEGAA